MTKIKMKKKKAAKITPNNGSQFAGVITALITPFKKGRVDLPSLKRLVEHQLENGVQGFVVNGTTGESPTLERDEIETIFRLVKKIVGKTVPLLIGTGSNSTKETLKKTLHAQKLGADGALVVVPYYNKPPQRGLIAHYKTVADGVRLPVVLYNVPGRTVVSLRAETIIELSRVKNIVGVKEASGDLSLFGEIREKVSKQFLLSSGDDVTAVDFCNRGGHGVISVVSHVIPAEMVDLIARARRGDAKSTQSYQKFTALNKLMGIEPNPIPVKMALHLMGIIDSPELRLPLVTLNDGDQRLLAKELENLGVLK